MIEIGQRHSNGAISKLSICPKQLEKLKTFVKCGDLRARAKAVIERGLMESPFPLGIHLNRHLYIKIKSDELNALSYTILMIEHVGYLFDSIPPSYRYVKLSSEEFAYFLEITDIFCAVAPELMNDDECVTYHCSEYMIRVIDSSNRCPYCCTRVPIAED